MTNTFQHDPKLFVHVADLHLAPRASTIAKRDSKTHRLIRDLDMESAFVDSVDETLAQDPLPSAYVIAGDLFDTYRGSSDAFIAMVNQIRRLRSAGIKVLGIAGNHDTPNQMANTPMFSMLQNVFAGTSQPEDAATSALVAALRDAGKADADIADMLEASGVAQDVITRLVYNKQDDGVVLAYDTIEHAVCGDVEYVLLPHIVCVNGGFTEEELSPVSDSPYKVLVVHGVAAGDPSLHQIDEAKDIPISKWILDMDWDYIAFGHYHKPGWVPFYRGKAAYCGSLENTVISGPDVVMERGPVFVDLSEEPTQRMRMHIRRPREIVELADIDLKDKELNAEEVEQLIEELVLDAQADGCIVRHTVKNVPRSLYKAMSQRNFQHVNPEMLYIKTSYEFATEEAQKTKMNRGEIVDEETGEVSTKGAEDAFLPLSREIDEAIERLVADGAIRSEMQDKVKDLLNNYTI